VALGDLRGSRVALGDCLWPKEVAGDLRRITSGFEDHGWPLGFAYGRKGFEWPRGVTGGHRGLQVASEGCSSPWGVLDDTNYMSKFSKCPELYDQICDKKISIPADLGKI
jgi:hypothetical protein